MISSPSKLATCHYRSLHGERKKKQAHVLRATITILELWGEGALVQGEKIKTPALLEKNI